MRATYDRNTDSFHLRFSTAQIVDSEEVRPGLILDLDVAGLIVSIEFLDAHKQLAPEALDEIESPEGLS